MAGVQALARREFFSWARCSASPEPQAQRKASKAMDTRPRASGRRGSACLLAVKFCHLSGGGLGIKRVELIGGEAHAALPGLHGSPDLGVAYDHDPDDRAGDNWSVCLLDIDCVVIRPSSGDLHISLEIGPVERRLYLECIGARLAIDKKIGIGGNLADHLSIDLDVDGRGPEHRAARPDKIKSGMARVSLFALRFHGYR